MSLFVIFTVLLNRYILNRFDHLPKSKWATILLYIVLPGVFSLLCITTPWTHWFVSIDEAGVLYEEILFDAVFTPLMIIYVLTAVISAIHYAIKGRRSDRTTMRIAYNMIVFGVLIPTIYSMEALNAIHEGASQKEVLAGVRAAVDAFVKEAPQFDDLTMLGMKYFGPENKTETEES